MNGQDFRVSTIDSVGSCSPVGLGIRHDESSEVGFALWLRMTLSRKNRRTEEPKNRRTEEPKNRRTEEPKNR
jgi:hypothetical protein